MFNPETEIDISADVAQLRAMIAKIRLKCGQDPVARAAIVGALAATLGEAIGDLNGGGHEDLEKLVQRTNKEVDRVATQQHFRQRMGRTA